MPLNYDDRVFYGFINKIKKIMVLVSGLGLLRYMVTIKCLSSNRKLLLLRVSSESTHDLFNQIKGCLPQNVLDPFMITLSSILLTYNMYLY